MKVNQLTNNKVNIQPTFGNRKIPKYLYQLTLDSSAKAMLESGRIHVSDAREGNCIAAVFMFDLHNLIRNWKKNALNGGDDLITTLIKHVMDKNSQDKLTLIRIKTKHLVQRLLLLRRLNKFCEAQNSFLFQIVQKHFIDTGEVLGNHYFHIFNGLPAQMSRMYSGEPVEYAYKADINMKDVEIVNSADIDIDNLNTLEIFEKLLVGTRELSALKAYR